MSENQSKSETRIGNYKIIKQIGKGSFGTVYEVKDDDGNIFALKLEENTLSSDKSQLENEYKVYLKMQNIIGIPKVHYFARTGPNGDSYLVLDKLEFSLNDVLDAKKSVSLKSVAMLGKRMIRIIEQFHKKMYIYRDMKPENILIKNGNEIYLIDYGMSKKYIINGQHIPLLDNKVLTGTARYVSVNTHKGYEQSRRDDLEGIGYVLIYLLRGGELPWMGIPAPTRREKYNKIGEIKDKTTLQILCKDLPGKELFIEYVKYCKNLEFEETPNYEYLIKIFEKMMKKYKLKDDGNFDWMSNENIVHKTGKKTCWEKFKSIFSMCDSK